MDLKGKKLLVCDCNGTMVLDGKALARACGHDSLEVNTLLCRSQLATFEAAVKEGKPLIVACTQEAPLFAEARAEADVDTDIRFANIREHAGWSDDGARAIPKIAALLAEAALDIPATPAMSVKCAGMTLIYGRDGTAIDAARQIADRLDCTVLLSKPGNILPPRLADIPIFKGTVVSADGHLGEFEVVVDDYAAMIPSSRGALRFEVASNGAISNCDLILDLTGGTPLFPAHETRDGYLRADPNDPVAVQKALFEIVEMVGEFEKPLYVAYDAAICAHSRAAKTGCTRCLDVCPTGAIASVGDRIEIDAHVCAGCGNCASVCPTGAATYEMPTPAFMAERLRTILTAYGRAGGQAPVLLVHDGDHGEEMLSVLARQGRGLPAHVIPFRVNAMAQVGFDFFATALSYGASQVRLLAKSRQPDDHAAQIRLANTVMSGLGYGEGRVTVIDDTDPDAVEATLYGVKPPEAAERGSFLLSAGKRSNTLVALRHLHNVAPEPVDVIPLTAGAAFGTLAIDVEGCTLCLSCVPACPTGALADSPDKPMLRFIEDACVQCGLCKAVCPENVIALQPQLNFTAAAATAVTIKEEEPAPLIREITRPILRSIDAYRGERELQAVRAALKAAHESSPRKLDS